MIDVIVVGGGPGGLQAALTLARGQRTVAVVDAGPPRNARAAAVHNFLTRDGTPPAELRRLARAELDRYGVEVEGRRAIAITGERGAFTVELDEGSVTARRVLLAVGMVDLLPELPGFEPLWGHTVFQCPYCHGHEVRGQRFAALAASEPMLDFAILLRAWTDDVVALTDGRFPVTDAARARLASAGVLLDERPLAALTARAEDAGRLAAITFTDGAPLPRDILFARPPQRQTDLVATLALALDPQGYLLLDDHRQTSRPGIYAAGDSVTMMQSALGAASAGMHAAAMLNHELTVSLWTGGA